MNKKMIKFAVFIAMAVACGGCVVLRDRIPIMGESEDGTKTIVAYASRTRGYVFSKAAEKIDLWKVSSVDGVEMTGSDANSDSTRMIDAIERGIDLGGRIVAARMGVESSLTSSARPSNVSAANYATEPPTAPRTVSGGAGAINVVILGNRKSCSFCKRLWAGLDAGALSSDLCGATITNADQTDNPRAYAAYRPSGGFSYPYVVVFGAAGDIAGQFVARNFTQATLKNKIASFVPECAVADTTGK